MSLSFKLLLDRYVGWLLLACLNPVARMLGFVLHRDHSLKIQGDILIIKMLGGGSLVMALPALLGIRRAYPDVKMRILTTKAVAPFAQTLGVFDEILAIQDNSLSALMKSSLQALSGCMKSDTVIDLEIYSNLTTVFSVLTCARNRLGFFFEERGYRQQLHTHRVFFHPASPVYKYYDAMATMVGASIVPMFECNTHVRGILGIEKSVISLNQTPPERIAVGCGCSALFPLRKLAPEQWARNVFAPAAGKEREAIFLGAKGDYADSEEVIAAVRNMKDEGWRGSLTNICGETSLTDSLRILAGCEEFWGIDSSLLHYARLFGLRIQAFFGPINPKTHLRPIPGLEETIRYRKTLCSPCVHQLSSPPCNGDNVCMKRLFEIDVIDDEGQEEWTPIVTKRRAAG